MTGAAERVAPLSEPLESGFCIAPAAQLVFQGCFALDELGRVVYAAQAAPQLALPPPGQEAGNRYFLNLPTPLLGEAPLQVVERRLGS